MRIISLVSNSRITGLYETIIGFYKFKIESNKDNLLDLNVKKEMIGYIIDITALCEVINSQSYYRFLYTNLKQSIIIIKTFYCNYRDDMFITKNVLRLCRSLVHNKLARIESNGNFILI